jgi:hypothetical protein
MPDSAGLRGFQRLLGLDPVRFERVQTRFQRGVIVEQLLELVGTGGFVERRLGPGFPACRNSGIIAAWKL